MRPLNRRVSGWAPAGMELTVQQGTGKGRRRVWFGISAVRAGEVRGLAHRRRVVAVQEPFLLTTEVPAGTTHGGSAAAVGQPLR